jgi:pimeloyl-ACP methyl ester carboxylesterase
MRRFDELAAIGRRMQRLGGVAESWWLARRRVPPIDAHDRARGVHRIELAHSTVRLRTVGSGARTIVLVPDPPNTLEHYDELVELLRQDALVVVFEVPGFGLSYPRSIRFGFSPHEYAAVVIELLDHLELRDVTLGFSCIGGYVGLLAARQRPAPIGESRARGEGTPSASPAGRGRGAPVGSIGRLILSQTPAHDQMLRWARRFDRVGLLGVPVLGQALMMIARDRATRFWYPAALPEGADAARYLQPALAAQRLGGPYSLASGIQSMRTLDPDALRGVAQPTTIVWGHADRTHAKTSPRSLLQVVPHARFVSFERCGHFPDLEDPRRFARLILEQEP